MNFLYWGKKIWNNTRRKVSIYLYLKKNQVESIQKESDFSYLEEKWTFKNANCYIERGSDWIKEKRIDLSIIIPLYNAEKFIHTCINQIINQKTKYEFQLILVNDGSKDRTAIILEEYRKKYPNVILVINQENQGISCARNAGITVSCGRYLCFVDQDDLVELNFVEKLISTAYEKDADIVKAAYTNEKNGRVKNIQEQTDIVVEGGLKDKLLQYRSYIFAGVYKRELFEHINFPEGYWYEDMITRTLLYRQSKCFVHISDILYRKQFHSSNAFEVVWDYRNYKCLEHIYLLINIIDTNLKLGIKEDVWFYKCILCEISTILYQRIRGVDEKTKQMAFLEVCDIVEKIYRVEFEEELSEKEKLWQRTFLQKEYTLWLLLGGIY